MGGGGSNGEDYRFGLETDMHVSLHFEAADLKLQLRKYLILQTAQESRVYFCFENGSLLTSWLGSTNGKGAAVQEKYYFCFPLPPLPPPLSLFSLFFRGLFVHDFLFFSY